MTAILNMKVLKPGHVQLYLTTANLNCDQNCCPFSCTKTKIRTQHLQATSISYTLLVADYQSSIATLSYTSL